MSINNIIPKKYKLVQRQFIINSNMNFNIPHKQIVKMVSQKGGGKYKEKEYIFYYDNEKYIFTVGVEIDDDTDIKIAVLNTKNNDHCITVLIYPDIPVAILNNITYDIGCSKQGLKYPGGGDVLMRFIIHYLTERKNEYKINSIQLTDNSSLICSVCDHSVKLARLRMITHGEPWYIKYGFKPFDSELQKPDEKLLYGIKFNNELLETLKTNQLDIINNVKKINVKLIDEVKRLADKYKLLKDFIKRLSNEYNKYCCLLESLLNDIYDPQPGQIRLLIDYYRKTYYLNI